MPSNASVIKRSQEQEPVGSTDGFFIHEVPEKQRDRLSGRRVLEGSSGKNRQFSLFRWNDCRRPSFKRRPHGSAGQERRWTVSEANLTYQARCLVILIFIGDWLKFSPFKKRSLP
jgi:hypothetical protein